VKLTRLFGVFTILTVLALLTVPAQAGIYTLTDHDATISVNDASSLGVSEWTVDGVNNLFQQWFWYRTDDGLAHSIDTIGPAVESTYLGTRGLSLDYSNSQLSIDILYTLTGHAAGSGHSDISETISFLNLGTTTLNLVFFQYSDFDLNGVTGGQTVTFTNANTVVQTGGGLEMTETADVPTPDRHEANTWANTLNSLTAVPGYILNNANTATGDATWAFQWDITLAPGGSFDISKNKILEPSVPEPAAIFGLGTVLLLVGSRLRKRVRA